MKKLIIACISICFFLGTNAQENTINLSLKKAIKYAIKNSYNTKASKNDIKSANEKVWETTTIGLPQINGKLDYQNWLKQQIEDNYLNLDPELSLRSLAETLDIHPNLTSKIINEGLKQSFSDCINQYRINAVIEKLESPDNQDSTFLAIAFNCGFNSKATFNRVFKKSIGQTPLQYKSNLKKS